MEDLNYGSLNLGKQLRSLKKRSDQGLKDFNTDK